MPSVSNLKTRVGFAVSRRFATRASRFRLALSSGFVIAGTILAGVAFDSSGMADDLFGSIGTIFGVAQAPQTYEQAAASSPRFWRHRTRRVARLNREHVRSIPVRQASDREQPTRLGRQSICVRLCDGFAFPIGAFHGEGDQSVHEQTCRSECPGARTALYVLPNGSDRIDDAVDVRTGRNYSALPDAFHYTTLIDSTCSCHPASGNRVASLLHDFTLRRGDAVMTPRGVRVFHGGQHYPYRQADFVPLAKSPDVKRVDRQTFHAIERASLPAPRVAESAPSSEKISMLGDAAGEAR